MTTHISSSKDDISSIVLMPGCPKRAKWIADNFLTNTKLVSEVRNMYAFTGYYKDIKVTIMGSGMGMGSCGIYSYELFDKKYFNVDLIIRVGSCGAYNENIKLNDIILIDSSFSDSSHYLNWITNTKNTEKNSILFADAKLIDFSKKIIEKESIPIKLGRAYCTDVFYDARKIQDIVEYTKADIVEMESWVLFANAFFHKKHAISLVTCADLLYKEKTCLNSEEREKSFKNMIIIALNIAIEWKKIN